MRVVARVLLALFIVTAPLAAALANLEARLFSIDTYRQALKPEAIASALPGLVSAAIAAQAEDPGSALGPIKEAQPAALERLLAVVAPPGALSAIAGDVAEQLLDSRASARVSRMRPPLLAQ